MSLVIVESPAKCQKIQGFLGAGWRVVATMGHIRALKHDLSAIGMNDGWKAQYEWIKEKSKAIQQLKEAAKGATDIYLAADRDREGENIAYSTALLLKLDPRTAKRITFTEITQAAIRHAVAHPTVLDMNQVKAQEARAMLDMMIGFTVSPLLWRNVAPSLSAGRCQTPAMRLVIERENQIESFQASTSWQLTATFNNIVASMTDELEDEESAVQYMENVHHTPSATVLSNTIKPWSESAPPPLMTSTLQQQASARFNMNPKMTMQVAQKLYEAGHITYMRTDKAVLSEEAAQEARALVTQQYGEEYLSKSSKEPSKKAQAAQEAHEAIRPTHMEHETIDGDVFQTKLYRLIWQRTIQSVMAPAKGETCTIRLQITGDTDFEWSAMAKRTTFDGWRRIGLTQKLEEEDPQEDTEFTSLSNWKEGDTLTWSSMKAFPKETKASGRYNEATLVRELETKGIGRPSTFASLLSVIQDKQYVVLRDFPPKEVDAKEYSLTQGSWPPINRTIKKKVGAEKQKLVPTELGRSVWAFLSTHLEDLFAYGFTAHMERRLDDIAEGKEERTAVLQETWDSYKERCEALQKAPRGPNAAKEVSARVREFSNGLKAVQSKKGPLLLIEHASKETEFLGWPKGARFDSMTEEKARAFIAQSENSTNSVCFVWNSQPIVKRTGKFGDYFQCGTTTIPFQEEPVEETIKRLEAKEAAKGPIKEFKEYVIRTGPYGPYIMKTSLKKAKFVSLPKGIDVQVLSEKDVEALYRLGLESKKKPKE